MEIKLEKKYLITIMYLYQACSCTFDEFPPFATLLVGQCPVLTDLSSLSTWLQCEPRPFPMEWVPWQNH